MWLWLGVRWRGGHSLIYGRFQGGWRRRGVAQDSRGWRGWTCRQHKQPSECEHTIAKLDCHTYSFVPLLVDWMVFAGSIQTSVALQ